MISILIVDDNSEKVRLIKNLILEIPDIQKNQVRTFVDLNGARLYLENNSVDLLILDLFIPNEFGDTPVPENGIDFLGELYNDKNKYCPSEVIGLTAHEEAIATYEKYFSDKLWHLIKCKEGYDDWKQPLRNRVNYLIKKKYENIYPSNVRYDYDVAIITALASPELSEVLKIGNWEKREITGDSTIYYVTILVQKDISIRVVAAHAPQMGMCAASTLTMKLISNFRPQYIIMCGIAAAVRDGDLVNLGDILVAEEVWDGASGKIKTTEDNSPLFLPDYRHKTLDEDIGNIIKNIKLEKRYLHDIREGFPSVSGKPKTVLDIHIGPMASVPAVIQNTQEVDEIKKHSRKLIGIEMESYGVFYSAKNCSHPKPKVISIKSVSDFADEKKSDDYQEYAAYTSAQFACRLIMNDLIYIND